MNFTELNNLPIKIYFKLTKINKINKYCSIFLFFIFLLIISEYNNNNESIYFKENVDSLNEAFNKAKNFIDINTRGILLNTEKIIPFQNPKISVVIPCYNSKNYILRTIRSIQNQNFSNFEIVLVDDFSIDNTLSYLQKLKEEDPRIKIIRNKQNKGILYTMATGALSSKGKYIFPIDNDDMFLDKDVFSTIIKVADKGNFDIVLFDIIISSLQPNVYNTSYWPDIFKKERIPNLVLFQPELSYYPIQPKLDNKGLNLVEVLLNGKCIRTNIYKQALYKLGEERYSRYMTVDSDIILNYINFNEAKSMKYIAKFGYLYIKRKGSSSKTQFDKLKLLLYRIYMLDVFIIMSKNTFRHKKILINLLNYLLTHKYLINTITLNKSNYNLFTSCLGRILNSKYITDDDKNEIRHNLKSINLTTY